MIEPEHKDFLGGQVLFSILMGPMVLILGGCLVLKTCGEEGLTVHSRRFQEFKTNRETDSLEPGIFFQEDFEEQW